MLMEAYESLQANTPNDVEMTAQQSDSEDEYEEFEENILVEFDGALNRQFLRDENSSLVITQLLHKPFMSVGPLAFQGNYEQMAHTAMIYTNPEQSKEKESSDDKSPSIPCEFVASCTKKLAMKRVLLTPKDQTDDSVNVEPEGIAN